MRVGRETTRGRRLEIELAAALPHQGLGRLREEKEWKDRILIFSHPVARGYGAQFTGRVLFLSGWERGVLGSFLRQSLTM